MRSTSVAGSNDLRFDRIEIKYPRTKAPVLSELSIEIPKGAVTALVGESGSGKSSLLYIAGLMLRPTSGELFVMGEEMSRASDRRKSRIRADAIGFVFQDAILDPYQTVEANVLNGLAYGHGRNENAAREASTLLDSLGVSVPPDRRPGHISGGQAQRIAVARALLKKPRIILADEPTGNLDPQNSDVVFSRLAQTAHSDGATVVIATHSMTLAASCDLVVKIAKGEATIVTTSELRDSEL